MAENYKEFDKSPIIDTSDVVVKGFRFRVRELALAIAVVVCLLVIIILAALLGASKSGSSDCRGDCYSPPCLKTAAHVTELINSSADPCQDFHKFACGNFPQLHPLVPEQQEMTTFQLIHEKNWERLRRLLEQKLDPKKATEVNYERKLRTFFATCQDHFTKMQQQGKPFLDNVAKKAGGWWALEGDSQWDNQTYDFQQQLKLVHVDFWTDAFFTFSITTDWLNWNKRAIQIGLSGIGLPIYYYTDPEMAQYLDDYKTFMETVVGYLLRDSGLEMSVQEKKYRVDTVVHDALYVEKELATMKSTAESTLNPHAKANRVKLSELNTASQGAVDWVGLFTYMFDNAPVTADTSVVVLEKEYVLNFTAWINDLPSSNKSRILNNYLMWRLAHRYVQDLSWDYIHANRQVYVDLTGVAEFLGTWRYCLYKVDRDMKEALGAIFVENHFSEENKKTAHEITDHMKTSLLDSLENSQWWSSQTKDLAMKKVKESIMRLGYPEYLTNEKDLNTIYSTLKIGDDYFQNLLNFNAFYRSHWNQLLKAPTDRTLWPYAAYDFVAHYYSPWKQLFVPAGLLQFPIYDHSSPRYTNYGSMGTIVGRQLTHAVDEIGNYYMLNGSGYGSWWSNKTTQKYKEVRECIVKAFENTTMGPFKIPGGRPLTVPVDIEYYAPLALGDATSVKLAYKAYHTWIDKTGGEKQMPGRKYSNDQMFFISFAQTYCHTLDPDWEYVRISQGRRPTENVRVNSALAQVPEFQKAFKCSATSKMVAPKRCNLF